ncbi:5-oxoprolinase subunit PxpB [Fulvivirgaceae bacterium PWU4]|uniref:5-oxoprolinase subunit PxpB n=1 Tax=Chryseosolibacter histidini TaxID=2782349 RepID=A0AAP2GHV3_9BACT|nr:5-oxoprolinase subunit PxpB [Chryseosolibacter histidini]MBT1696459.1 5-oxoprolinase subunit PxpB [Chryseosolibacter histidini]
MEDFTIYPLGDQALTFSLGNSIRQRDHERIQGMKRWLEQHPPPGLTDIVVAYSSLTVVYDLYQLRQATHSSTAFEFVSAALREAFHRGTDHTADVSQKRWEVPVCYDQAFAPDLDHVARLGNLSTAEVITLHTARVYRIFMIGFLPGFPYMAEVDASIAAPRRDQPRQVEAGSVGIAGIQTGIYPVSSPGGWQIIGRTPLKMFDRGSDPPVHLEPGHEVRFYAVTRKEFEDLSRQRA